VTLRHWEEMHTAFLDEVVWRPGLIGFVWDRAGPGRNVRFYREAFWEGLTSESQARVETLLNLLGSITDDHAAASPRSDAREHRDPPFLLNPSETSSSSSSFPSAQTGVWADGKVNEMLLSAHSSDGS